MRGASDSSRVQIDVAPCVRRFTALRRLCLYPQGGVTLACIADLSALQ